MKYRRHIIAAGAALALLTAGSAPLRADERPSLYGFAPAYPVDTLPAFVTDRNAPFTPYERVTRFHLELSADGAVRSVTPADSGETRFLNHIADYLKSLRFVPAAFNGKDVASILPVDIIWTPRRQEPQVLFPIDHKAAMANRRLLTEILRLNNIQPPRIRSFPPYFAELHWSDTSTFYPIVLLKLDLDAQGGVTAAEAIRSTLPAGPGTLLSSTLWAEFAPLELRGEAKSSECFLLISFFPRIVYPTRPWTDAAADTLPPMERAALQMFGDTAGLVIPPVVRHPDGRFFTVPGRAVYSDRDTVGADIVVDTLGNVRVQRFDSGHGDLSEAVRTLSGKLPFYPATSIDGRAVPFRGRLLATGSVSGKLRITYLW